MILDTPSQKRTPLVTFVQKSSMELFKDPPYLKFHPPLLEGGRRRRRREKIEDFGSFFIDFLHKIAEFEAKSSKKFAPAARLPWEVHF